MLRVTRFDPLSGHRLRVGFNDGLVREVDCSFLLHGTLGEPLRDPDYFRRARVDEEARTVVWPNGLDPVPELLHGGYEPPASPSGYEPELVKISRHAGTTQRPRREPYMRLSARVTPETHERPA